MQEKNVFIVLFTLILAMIMNIFYYQIRTEDQYIKDNQTYATIDSEFYEYLIKNYSLSDIAKVSPNIQTMPFLFFEKIKQSIFGETRLLVYLINTIGVIFSLIWVSNKLKFSLLESIVFISTCMPMMSYSFIISKEFYVLIGTLVLLTSNLLDAPSVSLPRAFGFLMLLIGRPGMALIFFLAYFLSYIFSFKSKILIYLFLIISAYILITNSEFRASVYLYQLSNQEYQNSNCNIAGLNICLDPEVKLYSDIFIYLKRFFGWFLFRYFKGFSQFWVELFSGNTFNYFEHLFNFSAFFATVILTFYVFRNFTSLNFIFKIKGKSKTNIILLFIFTLVSGCFIFFQSQRIYILIYPIIFFIIRDLAKYSIKK